MVTVITVRAQHPHTLALLTLLEPVLGSEDQHNAVPAKQGLTIHGRVGAGERGRKRESVRAMS